MAAVTTNLNRFSNEIVRYLENLKEICYNQTNHMCVVFNEMEENKWLSVITTFGNCSLIGI